MKNLFSQLLLVGLLSSWSVNGLTDDSFADDDWDDWGDDWSEATSPAAAVSPFSGFIEGTFSLRIKGTDLIDEDWVAQDIRSRLQADYQGIKRGISYSLAYKGDLFYDAIDAEWHGENREFYLGITPLSAIDVRVGRQVLTWGTGDLVFLNDFFPKNWVAFFSGFDQQYLKAPSDALKISGYSSFVNFDLVWSPEFDPDRFITGEKLVFYSPMAQALVAAPPPLQAQDPGSNLKDGELSMRLHKTVNGVELAAYFYQGFFKSPRGFDPINAEAFFPQLQSLGASARATLWGGVSNIETAYWNSKDSGNGRNPQVPNDQLRFLVGHEREIARNLTANFQYYVELTQDYDQLKARLSVDQRPRKVRQLITNRWTWITQQANRNYSLFLFYSPSDEDLYLIPNAYFRWGDHWQFNVGANLLKGEKDSTLFGQMEFNSNVYTRIKYIF